MKPKDAEHSKMILEYIKTHKDRFEHNEKTETEYYFNYYGERGYIDLISYFKGQKLDIERINQSMDKEYINSLLRNKKTSEIQKDPIVLKYYIPNNYLFYYEFKTILFDIGDTIRKIKLYYNNLCRLYPITHICGILVLFESNETYKHLAEYYNLFELGLKNMSFYIEIIDRTYKSKYNLNCTTSKIYKADKPFSKVLNEPPASFFLNLGKNII